MNFDGSSFAGSLLWCGVAVVFVLLVTFVAGRIAGKHSVIDTSWGLLFCAIAIATFVASSGHGDPVRRALLIVMPLVWGLRLAVHIARRSIGKPEDPRYDQLLGKAKGNPDLYALRSIYLLQGLLVFVIASPIMVGGFEGRPVRVAAWIGVVVWALGLFFEATGDQQMEKWRADPANKGKVIDVGLWRYTRHPNYFGDACVWWGIFLVAADALPGVVTVFAPILMTLLLTKGSGARILEKHMSKREGWEAYATRTSMFFPLPPKSAAAESTTAERSR